MTLTKVNNFLDLLVQELKDQYSVEIQLNNLLPEIADSAYTNELKTFLTTLMKAKKCHLSGLEKAFFILGLDSRKETCVTVKDLIKELKGIADLQDMFGPVKDAILISGLQRILHYEIAGYGSAMHFAEILEEDDALAILAKNRDELKLIEDQLNSIVLEIVD